MSSTIDQTLSYEVYVRQGKEWKLELVTKNRDTAIWEAKDIFQSKSISAVRVEEEGSSADSDEVNTKTILRLNRDLKKSPKNPADDEAALKAKGRNLKIKPYQTPSQNSSWNTFVFRLVGLVIVVGGIALGTLLTLAHLMD